MADTPAGPTVFNDRYELHRKLARGGMADVYLARDLLLDRQVAVKVLFPEYARDATFVERFRREAKAAANLNHPNIVAVYDWGEQLGTYFIVMEYVDGRPLSEVIHGEGALDAARSAQVTSDVADALAFAHHNGVVHRDIKPGNILITPNGQVKVADFGIAQAGASEATQASLTQVGAVMGTATYFSPEQAQGRPVDPRSDLYSLGCVLYEMLTARPPFSGDTPLAIAYKHVQEAPVPPSQINPAIPAPLEAVDLKLLAKDPDNRYATAGDLKADLDRFSRGEPVAAAAFVGMDDATRVVAPVPVPVPPTLVGGAPAGAAEGPGGPGDGDDGKPEGASNRGPWVAALIALLAVLAIVLVVLALRLNQGTADATVPAVGNLTEQEARARLEQAGFRVQVTQENNDTVEAGRVVNQEPTGGSRAPEGSTVTIFVSLGRGEVEVPDVKNMSESAARLAVERAGLVPDVVQEAHPDVRAGQVVSQDPAAGTRVQKDSFVRIVVSSGPETVTVPSVSGSSVAQATSRLQEAGFRVATSQRSEPSSSVPAGSVAGTDPAAGESAPRGSTITLILSSGPPTTTTTTPSTTSTGAPSTTSTLAAEDG